MKRVLPGLYFAINDVLPAWYSVAGEGEYDIQDLIAEMYEHIKMDGKSKENALLNKLFWVEKNPQGEHILTNEELGILLMLQRRTTFDKICQWMKIERKDVETMYAERVSRQFTEEMGIDIVELD